MGCDIHMYVEYRRKDSTGNSWSDFGERINPGRNYYMFGILADVRAEATFNFKPKGLPENLAYESEQDYYCYIGEQDDDNYVSLERAKRWEESGNKIIEHNGEPWKVENPDWHSTSWLTTEEYKQAIEFYNQHEDAVKWREPEYEALLAAMQKLEEMGYEARVVFWFDN